MCSSSRTPSGRVSFQVWMCQMQIPLLIESKIVEILILLVRANKYFDSHSLEFAVALPARKTKSDHQTIINISLSIIFGMLRLLHFPEWCLLMNASGKDFCRVGTPWSLLSLVVFIIYCLTHFSSVVRAYANFHISLSLSIWSNNNCNMFVSTESETKCLCNILWSGFLVLVLIVCLFA